MKLGNFFSRTGDSQKWKWFPCEMRISMCLTKFCIYLFLSPKHSSKQYKHYVYTYIEVSVNIQSKNSNFPETLK